MRLNDKIKNSYEKILKEKGEDYFYKYSLGIGFLDKNENSCINMLDKSELFFSLFRTTGNVNYSIIGKNLRRAAHKLYRNNLKSGKCLKNKRFLNLIA